MDWSESGGSGEEEDEVDDDRGFDFEFALSRAGEEGGAARVTTLWTRLRRFSDVASLVAEGWIKRARLRLGIAVRRIGAEMPPAVAAAAAAIAPPLVIVVGRCGRSIALSNLYSSASSVLGVTEGTVRVCKARDRDGIGGDSTVFFFFFFFFPSFDIPQKSTWF